MSLHSYTRCWVHFIWSTLNREKVLHKEAAKKLAEYFHLYTKDKQIYIKQLFVNQEHVHILLDLPTNMSIEDIAHLLKGSSSNWINRNNIINSKLSWGRGYGAFSVSQSLVDKVSAYISKQEEHHRTKSFTEEYEEFIKRYKLSLNR